LSGGWPKPLLEVGGRSLLEWNLRWLLAAGVCPLWVNLHYRAMDVRRAILALGLPAGHVHLSYEDPILGTAGAWRYLAAEWAGTSLVVYGDNLTRFDLAAFMAAHRAARSAAGGRPPLATVALFDPTRHANTGIAGSRVLVGPDGRVTGFEERRGGEVGAALVNTGACLLEPAVADRIPPGLADFGADVFPDLAAEGLLAAHVIGADGFCLGLDTPRHFRIGEALVDGGQLRLD
jgi:mannose-1-phosphate guanylyltransferase